MDRCLTELLVRLALMTDAEFAARYPEPRSPGGDAGDASARAPQTKPPALVDETKAGDDVSALEPG